jgi:hypothetical protein
MSFRDRAKGSAGTFQRGKFPNPHRNSETPFNNSAASPLHTTAKKPQRTASLDVLAEPNYYSKRLETSSTRVFASHLSEVFGAASAAFSSGAC